MAKKIDADFSQIDKLFRDAKAKIDANWNERGESTLAYVYFRGHGVTDGLTHAVCGRSAKAANKPEQWTYPIERRLQLLAKTKGAYVVALLNCGR